MLPIVVALLAFLAAGGTAVAGVYVLAGEGWALIAAALPLLALGFVILRGAK